MKMCSRNLLSVSFLSISAFISCLLAVSAFGAPIDFGEVSLLVRARESESSISQEVATRKLTRPLTQDQENTLKKQGASESLVQRLRTPANVLSTADATAYEVQREQMRKNRATASASSGPSTDAGAPQGLHIIDVPRNHPINLSQWGGPGYFDLVFDPATRSDDPSRFDEDRYDAVLVDPIRTGTEVLTYHGGGFPDDNITMFPHRDYVSSTSYSYTRGLRIDFSHPISMKGSPYTMYPVYAAGGVSLYYIGGSSDSVKLAVSTISR